MRLKYDELNLREYEAHAIILSKIDKDTKILDLGCATGYMGNYLAKEKNCQVWGVEYDRKLAKKARKVLKKVILSDLEDLGELKIPKHYFDYILLADVLEHVTFCEKLLKIIKIYMRTNGKLIISTPNIAHVSTRVNLFLGKFDYQDKGILDATHVHFFTKKSLIQILEKTGFKIVQLDCSADFGQIPYIGRILRHIPKATQYFITKKLDTVLAVQFIPICIIK